MNEVVASAELLKNYCYEDAVKAGWWTDLETGEPKPCDVPRALMLVVTELAEAMEGYRTDSMDKHLPHRKSLEVELADAVIRIFNMAGGLNIDLPGAINEKLRYNRTRADHKPENRRKEGGKKF